MLRPDARREKFRQTQDTEDARRKREAEALRIRKEKRDGALQKKRNVGAPWAGELADDSIVDRTGMNTQRVRAAGTACGVRRRVRSLP